MGGALFWEGGGGRLVDGGRWGIILGRWGWVGKHFGWMRVTGGEWVHCLIISLRKINFLHYHLTCFIY